MSPQEWRESRETLNTTAFQSHSPMLCEDKMAVLLNPIGEVFDNP